MSMSQRGRYIVGLDIGSSFIKTVILQETTDDVLMRVLGVGKVPSSGIRRGAVVSIEEAAEAVSASLAQAESMAGVSIRSVTLCIGGAELFSQDAKGVVAVGKSDGEVLPDDVQRVLHSAQSVAVPLNKEIIHALPKTYRLDDQKDIKDPVGMRGVRLEADALIIGGSAPHLKNMMRCVEHANLNVDDTVVGPLASATAVLNRKQRELGAAVIDIGGATTSLSVFEENDVLHIRVLPIGAAHITNDIAIGLRTSIEVAEQVKILFGTAIPNEVGKDEDIDLAKLDVEEEGLVSRYHVAEIIQARTEEILQLVDDELKSIGRSGLLPAGIILTGGGAKLMGIAETAKEVLRLPVQIGYPQPLGGILDTVDDPEFSAAVGAALWASEGALSGGSEGIFGGSGKSGFVGAIHTVVAYCRGLFEKFLP